MVEKKEKENSILFKEKKKKDFYCKKKIKYG